MDRWTQLISAEHQPDYVEIITWNDFGESHYIGPLDDRQVRLLSINDFKDLLTIYSF